MKKSIYSLLFLFLSVALFAQGGKLMKEKREQIKALKIAFITNELDLTPDEATKFWPLYNAFEEKQQEIRFRKMKNFMERLDDEDYTKLSEKEAATMLTQLESSEEEMFQYKKKFIANLKTVISPLKILKLKKAEEDFSRKLLQQYRDKRRRN